MENPKRNYVKKRPGKSAFYIFLKKLIRQEIAGLIFLNYSITESSMNIDGELLHKIGGRYAIVVI
jgi:hypothetical protein